jgi:hypothetical protein
MNCVLEDTVYSTRLCMSVSRRTFYVVYRFSLQKFDNYHWTVSPQKWMTRNLPGLDSPNWAYASKYLIGYSAMVFRYENPVWLDCWSFAVHVLRDCEYWSRTMVLHIKWLSVICSSANVVFNPTVSQITEFSHTESPTGVDPNIRSVHSVPKLLLSCFMLQT